MLTNANSKERNLSLNKTSCNINKTASVVKVSQFKNSNWLQIRNLLLTPKLYSNVVEMSWLLFLSLSLISSGSYYSQGITTVVLGNSSLKIKAWVSVRSILRVPDSRRRVRSPGNINLIGNCFKKDTPLTWLTIHIKTDEIRKRQFFFQRLHTKAFVKIKLILIRH